MKIYGKQQDERKWNCRSREDAEVGRSAQTKYQLTPPAEGREAKEQQAAVSGGGDEKGRLRLTGNSHGRDSHKTERDGKNSLRCLDWILSNRNTIQF